MLTSFGLYLIESSCCLAVFALLYRALFARLTHFAWNRAYLLGALGLSLVLPLVAFPGLAALISWAAPKPVSDPLLFRLPWVLGRAATHQTQPIAPPAAIWAGLLAAGPLVAYAAGFLYRFGKTARSLWWLRQTIRRNPRTRMGSFWLVQLPGPDMPAFSFGRFVFLSPLHEGLNDAERQQLLEHERVHVRQGHTLDLLFFEAGGLLLWFHPLVSHLKKQLKNVHEYLADEAVAHGRNSRSYGQLLIKLAAQQPPLAFVHAFSDKQIFQRIHMLTQPTSRPMQKLRFLLVVPAVALTWLATTAMNPAPDKRPQPVAAKLLVSQVADQQKVVSIAWQGNSAFSTDRLNQELGLKPGDAYDEATVKKRLNAVSSLYMDQGYLFFSVNPQARRRPDGQVDLTLSVSEGRQANIGAITVKGNYKTSTEAVLQAVSIQPGDLFSRAKLMQAQQRLAHLGAFDPTKIGINPRPVMRQDKRTDLVDLEFVVVEMN